MIETEDAMKRMFHAVEPDFKDSHSCSLEVRYNDETEEDEAHCMKDGYSCWHYTKATLMFMYITKDWS